MRPIKFRHPIVFNGKFHSWHYFGYIDNGFSGPQSVIEPRDQFTGLLDKNGKEIYEGDICLIGDEGFAKPMQITYEDGCFGVKWEKGHFAELKYYIAYPSCVVIGNIYENPELLKVKP